MMSPEEALDTLEDPIRIGEFADDEEMTYREAVRTLSRIAAPLFADDAPPLESQLVRRARAAGGRGRADVETLCDFVERAARLPGRPKEVFYLCIVNGLSLDECADRLGISRETVRVHLRRLRRLMREGEGSSPPKLPRVYSPWSVDPG